MRTKGSRRPLARTRRRPRRGLPQFGRTLQEATAVRRRAL